MYRYPYLKDARIAGLPEKRVRAVGSAGHAGRTDGQRRAETGANGGRLVRLAS